MPPPTVIAEMHCEHRSGRAEKLAIVAERTCHIATEDSSSAARRASRQNTAVPSAAPVFGFRAPLVHVRCEARGLGQWPCAGWHPQQFSAALPSGFRRRAQGTRLNTRVASAAPVFGFRAPLVHVRCEARGLGQWPCAGCHALSAVLRSPPFRLHQAPSTGHPGKIHGGHQQHLCSALGHRSCMTDARLEV